MMALAQCRSVAEKRREAALALQSFAKTDVAFWEFRAKRFGSAMRPLIAFTIANRWGYMRRK
jgi:hypothetical protein